MRQKGVAASLGSKDDPHLHLRKIFASTLKLNTNLALFIFLFTCKSRKEPPPTSPTYPGADTAMAALDGKSSNYLAALDANIENLQKRTQQLIDKINENRKKDHTVMSNFRESLLLKVNNGLGGAVLVW